MSATNKYELKYGFDSAYTKRIYSTLYINDQGNKELISIKYANEHDIDDRDHAIEWFKNTATNHNNAIGDNKENDIIAEFVPDNDEFNTINQPVQSINYENIYDCFEEVLDDLLGYIHDYIDIKVSNFYIDINVDSSFKTDVINKVKTIIHDRSANH